MRGCGTVWKDEPQTRPTVRGRISRHTPHMGRVRAALPTDRPKINIMRGTPWGNPYSRVHGDRDTVCDKFETWLKNQFELLNERWRLRGARLECCCEETQRCHGDTWVLVADMSADDLLDWMLDAGRWEPL